MARRCFDTSLMGARPPSRRRSGPAAGFKRPAGLAREAELFWGRSGLKEPLAHLVRRRDAQDGEAGREHAPQSLHEREPGLCRLSIGLINKPQMRQVFALVPQAMERAGEVVKKERD